MVPEDLDIDEHDLAAIAELQGKVDVLRGHACCMCGQATCGHEALFAIAAGNPRQPRCLGCLAAVLGRAPVELREHLFQHFRRRDCYGTVWRSENRREQFPPDVRPGCLWPEGTAAPSVSTPTEEVPAAAIELAPSADWDAGDTACGDLVLELRLRLQALPAGALLRLVAQDSGAREDIPAWCRLTGHRLVKGQHPEYWIQRKAS